MTEPMDYEAAYALEQDNVRLRTINAELLAVIMIAADALDGMTTEEFRHGKDKPIREALRAVIAKAEQVTP